MFKKPNAFIPIWVLVLVIVASAAAISTGYNERKQHLRWQTYRDAAYGFSVPYPQEWHTEEGNLPPGIVSHTIFTSSDFASTREYRNGGDFPSETVRRGARVDIRLETFEKPAYTFDMLRKDKTSPLYASQDMTIAGQQALYSFTDIEVYGSRGSREAYFIYPTAFPDKTLFFHLSLAAKKSDMRSAEKLFRQMLSGFALPASNQTAPVPVITPVSTSSPSPHAEPPAPNIPKGPFTRPDCATYRNAQHPGCCPDGTVETGDFTGQPICAPPGVVF